MEFWTCKGCGTTYSDGNPDLIVRHVAECDYVDGAGNECEVTIKWSVRHWLIARVKSSELAAVTGAMPFSELTGRTLDYDEGCPEGALPEFLDELEAGSIPETGDWKISSIYRNNQR